MAEPDTTIFGDANRPVVPGKSVAVTALGILGTLDWGKSFDAVFDWFVGDDILRFALPDVLGQVG